jgi:hypothetical protein
MRRWVEFRFVVVVLLMVVGLASAASGVAQEATPASGVGISRPGRRRRPVRTRARSTRPTWSRTPTAAS